jgi:hypothetical protein
MNNLFGSWPLAIATLHLALPIFGDAHAQPTPKTAEPLAASSLKPPPQSARLPLGFKSTFDHYKPYSEEKPGGWRAANDEVGRIGGWRVYLKEANEPDGKHESAPQPAPSSNPHSGHGKK